MKKLAFGLVAIAGLLAQMPQAHAQIAVMNVVRVMMPDKPPIQNVQVINQSDKRVLATLIKVYESTLDKDFKEVTKPSTDFLVAPQSMILRPHEQRMARLVLRRPPDADKERYYRINFEAKPPTSEQLAASGLPKSAQTDGLAAKINIVSGMGIFITVAPQNMNPKLGWKRVADGIQFTNTGNTTLVMTAQKNLCLQEKTHCLDLPEKRLAPGESWLFKVPYADPFTYYYKSYDDNYKVEITRG